MPPRASHGSKVTIAAARNGKGLFAARAFRRGEDILVITGRVVDPDLLWERGGRFMANCIRFGPESYLDPGDSAGKYINHSCEPNAGLRKVSQRLVLFAAARIAAGAELLFDYSTTIGDDDIWTMRCNCGAPSCRRIVRRLGALPPDRIERYLREGLVPKYIARTLSTMK
ncbi:MAG: SET domain-containing protein-lysine N-methyltransferase [Gemmatimonadales bacterium]|jgi:hypothetical protein